MKDKKKGVVKSFFICILFVLFPIQGNSTQHKDIIAETSVSASYASTPLVEVLQDLKVQTGYNFVIPDDWLGLAVSGEFSHVTLEKFFHRILKSKNFTLLINEKEKIITGRDFESLSNYTYIADTSGVVKDIDPYSGILTKELQELHAHQLREMQLWKADPESVDPLSGLTNGYLAELHKKQIDEKEMSRQRNDAVDPMSGIPLNELERMQKQQLASLKEINGAVDPMSGIPLDELKRMHEQQLKSLKR